MSGKSMIHGESRDVQQKNPVSGEKYPGVPAKSKDFVGRGGARERTQFSPQAETEVSGLCNDEPEDDVSPLFTTRLQEDARVGCLRGVFDGDGLSVSWLKGNETLESPAFDTELRDLLAALRNDGPLKNLRFMRQFCHGHPQARMSGRQTFYAFRIDASQHRYYLRLFPQKRKFYLFCYQTDQFREGRPEPDFNLIYRGTAKKKQKSGQER